MKGNILVRLFILLLGALVAFNAMAVKKTPLGDAPSREYVFVENQSDNNFFVTPGSILDPRMTGANSWTGLKYGGSGVKYQVGLGYIDDGSNRVLSAGNKFDMWLEGFPVSHPMTGLRCINWYKGCNLDTSLISPEATDDKGFYGVSVTSGDAKWSHGMLSDSFFLFLEQQAVGSRFSMLINSCQTRINYNASAGERCKDQSTGYWYERKVTHVKAAHLRFVNTNALAEVFINSDGIPTLGEGSTDCHSQVIGKVNGLACKMVNYNLQTNGLSNVSIHIFPAIANASLQSAIKSEDMQFSLDGNSWKKVNGISSYYTFNDLKSSSNIYVFFSSNLFKNLVKLGLSDTESNGLFNFRFHNDLSPESGWYEFSTSNRIIIKPRNFSVSIRSDDYSIAPSREGKVGASAPDLEFGYIVNTSGKTAADNVQIKVTGPSQYVNGRPYCIFSSADGQTRVPFPAHLSFTTSNNAEKNIATGCDDTWHDMTDALWIGTPWSDASDGTGILNKSTVKFAIEMNNPISLKSIDNRDWYGDVSASGEIHVKATWHNVN